VQTYILTDAASSLCAGVLSVLICLVILWSLNNTIWQQQLGHHTWIYACVQNTFLLACIGTTRQPGSVHWIFFNYSHTCGTWGWCLHILKWLMSLCDAFIVLIILLRTVEDFVVGKAVAAGWLQS
jgi:hypothetical protein